MDPRAGQGGLSLSPTLAAGTKHGEAGTCSAQKLWHLWNCALMANSKTVTSGAGLGKKKSWAKLLLAYLVWHVRLLRSALVTAQPA